MLNGFYLHLLCHNEIIVPVTHIDVLTFRWLFAQTQLCFFGEYFPFPMLPSFVFIKFFYFLN